MTAGRCLVAEPQDCMRKSMPLKTRAYRVERIQFRNNTRKYCDQVHINLNYVGMLSDTDITCRNQDSRLRWDAFRCYTKLLGSASCIEVVTL